MCGRNQWCSAFISFDIYLCTFFDQILPNVGVSMVGSVLNYMMIPLISMVNVLSQCFDVVLNVVQMNAFLMRMTVVCMV